MKWLRKLFGLPVNETVTEEKREVKSSIAPAAAEILEKQDHYWELFVDGIPVGYYKNPSRVAKDFDDLHRSKLYYHVNKKGTYKDDKYELICRKS